MNSSDIEESAIDNLKLFLRNDFLKPNFKTEDKNISWDGEIEVFDKPNKRKSDLLGEIPLQIKGKEVKSFNDSANYSINMFDLNNYLNDGGAIFFLVQLKKSKVYRVFYKSLLPMDINNLKKNKENQKTINIKLNKLDRNKVNDVCWEFLDNKNKQYSFKYKNIDNINFDNQIIKSGIFITKKMRIFLINKYQIIYRKGKLSNEEKYNLNKMKKNKDDNQILCAINILLDNKYEAELYYNKMNDYEKNEFSKYPIYNLIN
jgi:hypothetical protein